MGENFAFFLPIMMASFGVAFLIVWGWGAREAGWWSGAFFNVAMGFAVPVAFDFLPTDLWGIVADIALTHAVVADGAHCLIIDALLLDD